MMQIKNTLSVQNILAKTKDVVFRFPFAVAAAIVGTGIGVFLVDGENERILGKILLVCIVGFFLFLGVAILAEEKKISKISASLAAIVILIGYYLLMPQDFMNFREIHGVRTFLLGLVFVLFIVFAPFFKWEISSGFWHWNKKLLLRLAFTFISSLTLFAGIALSLVSFDFLFGVSIDGEWYERLLIFIAGIIAPAIFMAGIPSDYQELELESDYPKVVRIFAQYILVPLAAFYFFILYAYGAKIILTQNWPEGVVAYLVIAFSFFGIVTILLLYPERENMPWVKKISKIFYGGIMPLVFLLFGAIYVRIADYGFTPERCAVVIFGLWLLGISGYFASTKKYDIRIIFVTLMTVIIISAFGPWNVFLVSKNDQIGRLKEILSDKNILSEGVVSENKNLALTRKEYNQIISILDFIYSTGAESEIQPWFKKDIQLKSEESYWEMQEEILKEMGIEDENLIEDFEDQSIAIISNYLAAEDPAFYDVAGFDRLVYFQHDGDEKSIALANGEKISFSIAGARVVVRDVSGQEENRIIFEKELDELAANLLATKNEAARDNIPQEEMVVVMENKKLLIKVNITNMNVHKEAGKVTVDSLEAMVLVKSKL